MITELVINKYSFIHHHGFGMHEIFFPPKRTDPRRLLLKWYQRLFLRDKRRQSLKLTNHPHLAPRLRMKEAMSPLSYEPSGRLQ